MSVTEKIVVALRSCTGYRVSELKEQIERGQRGIDMGSRLHGAHVLLKPNLITARAPRHACTEGSFIGAVAQWLIDNGARVTIGDSPAFGSAEQVMRHHRIDRELRQLPVKIISLKEPRLLSLPHGVKIGVAAEALDCDLLINVPKIKAHNQMFMTMAVKNLFGTVCGVRKAIAHMRNGDSHHRFSDLMLDLLEVLPPQVIFADGIEVMHREGPVSGEALSLGCLAVSRDAVALETAFLRLLELDERQCPIWCAAEARRLPGCDLDNLVFTGCTPAEFHGSGFVAPAELNPVPFSPFRFLSSSVKRISGILGR